MNAPLLLQACLDGAYGNAFSCEGGTVCEAGFIYLLGAPDVRILDDFKRRWENRMFICLTSAWEEALFAKYPALHRVTRWEMASPAAFSEDLLRGILRACPADYAICNFDERAYAAKPFRHGTNYPTYAHFRAEGAGAVAWHDGEIVASASSFLTHRRAVELDISTHPAHRRKGLAAACAAKMLLDCQARDIAAHWDAQNIASKALAEKLGYRAERAYVAYCFRAPE